MKKRLILLLAVLVMIFCYHKYFFNQMLIGSYYNSGYENSPLTPNVPDSLILMEDNRFKSEHWGKGKYEVVRSLSGTRIIFSFDSGKESFSTYIFREWFGKPKIVLFRDINHFFIKS